MSIDAPVGLALGLGCAAAAWALTGMVRRLALSARMLDVPNERSSHTRPTPRGGGVAIVIVVAAATTLLALRTPGIRALAAVLLVGGGTIALIGLADDRWGLAARWRFLGHALAVAVAFAIWGLPPSISAFGHVWPAGLAGAVLAGFYMVWAINYYNFMDGIDGIASMQCITVALGGLVVGALSGHGDAAALCVVLAAAGAGFMAWNFPRARIFMGDAGSGFLGFAFGALTVWHGYLAPELAWAWLVLSASFLVDATTTLLRRVWRGERFFEAHRLHAYQFAARRLGSHVPVTLAYGLINLGWLLPIAALIAAGRLDGASGLLVACLPLVAAARRWRAGARELQGGS